MVNCGSISFQLRDLAFAHRPTVNTDIPTRRVLDKFRRSQHRPSLISSPRLTAPIACNPVKRWNFRKANWETFKQMTDVTTSQLPQPDTADTEEFHKAFCRIIINSAKLSIPREYNKNYIPCWDDECEQLYKEHNDSENTESASTATSLFNALDEKRRRRLNETVSSIDFTHSSRKAWQTLNSLTGRSTLKTGKCPVTANSIAAQLVQNGRFPNHDREFTRQVSKEYTSLPVIDPQLPQEQAELRPDRSTLDLKKVAKLTSDIEVTFDENLKSRRCCICLSDCSI